jgi:hypothetical protein
MVWSPVREIGSPSCHAVLPLDDWEHPEVSYDRTIREHMKDCPNPGVPGMRCPSCGQWIAEEDREVWVVQGSASGEELVRAAARAVDGLADRLRVHVNRPPV